MTTKTKKKTAAHKPAPKKKLAAKPPKKDELPGRPLDDGSGYRVIAKEDAIPDGWEYVREEFRDWAEKAAKLGLLNGVSDKSEWRAVCGRIIRPKSEALPGYKFVCAGAGAGPDARVIPVDQDVPGGWQVLLPKINAVIGASDNGETFAFATQDKTIFVGKVIQPKPVTTLESLEKRIEQLEKVARETKDELSDELSSEKIEIHNLLNLTNSRIDMWRDAVLRSDEKTKKIATCTAFAVGLIGAVVTILAIMVM